MPGILPMKVIKVGTSAQSRIAQACDRCRSKKIRCDGVTPCCSQCANVGFECKTSDKLSRRAFPRGYTESLEQRVRALESEVRELKDLLDEKDEKIDMLSRMHSFSSPRRPSAISTSSSSKEECSSSASQPKEDVFKVQQSPLLLEGHKRSEPYFMGASSGRVFVDAFKSKLQESGKANSTFDSKAFFKPNSRLMLTTPLTATQSDSGSVKHVGSEGSKVPPRLLSDQMINVFFQEWAPLFPVLHRPTFLKLYGEYVANPASIKDPHSIAQLHLVFGIAALSSETEAMEVGRFELQWLPALKSVMTYATLPTLQCLILAQIYCIVQGNHSRLLHYKGVAVTLSHRFGLHQSQKRFSLGALTRETRKKVFWSLYTIDCFSAAVMGVPKLLTDNDIQTELPADVDDENVTERGFQPALPGESTKLSSALALFRLARIISKVLQEVYPGDTSRETSLQKIDALSDELDEWNNDLAPHLRLTFIQDKPSTNVISSRSPLLSLAYYYTRTLIHRPVVTSSLGSKTSSSVIALADSSKHIIQIVQLLAERKMNFSFCLNKDELLLLAGFGLLFQNLDLNQEGRLIRDNQRLVCSVIQTLERDLAPSAIPFKKVACSIIAVGRFAASTSTSSVDLIDAEATSRKNCDTAMPAPQSNIKSARKQLQAIASRFSFTTNDTIKREQSMNTRRPVVPSRDLGNLALYARHSSLSLPTAQSEPVLKRANSEIRPRKPPPLPAVTNLPNLDYLPFEFDTPPTPAGSDTSRSTGHTSDWEQLLGYIDSSSYLDNNSRFENYNRKPGLNPRPRSSYETINSDYVSPSLNVPSPTIEISPAAVTANDWSPDVWDVNVGFSHIPPPAQSVFSLSDESLTSAEELSSVDHGNTTEYRGIMMPSLAEQYGLDAATFTF
ncbi:hypothetical protein MMC26_004976 [Xylographa opegraphella]|nr:hypothetical protein [Xylographa opegraphella]